MCFEMIPSSDNMQFKKKKYPHPDWLYGKPLEVSRVFFSFGRGEGGGPQEPHTWKKGIKLQLATCTVEQMQNVFLMLDLNCNGKS